MKIKNPESVADHTYVMSAMVMVFCDILGMKTERAMKMAILHDLGESIIGDYEPNVISSNEKRIKETEAIAPHSRSLTSANSQGICGYLEGVFRK